MLRLRALTGLFLALLLLGIFSGLGAPRAQASTLDLFTLTATDGVVIDFTLPSTLKPSGINGNCPSLTGEFCIDSVAVDINGVESTNEIEFFRKKEGGGLVIDGLTEDVVDQLGLQLFTGTLKHPVFKTGIFNLTNDPFSPNQFNENFKLDIAPVPEPSSLLLLGSGLLGLAGLARRHLA